MEILRSVNCLKYLCKKNYKSLCKYYINKNMGVFIINVYIYYMLSDFI